MRCLFLPGQQLKKDISLEISDKEDVNHLLKVLRAQIGDKILLVNGTGVRFYSKIVNISNKKFELEIIDKVSIKKDFEIEVLLGLPKKDTFETVVRKCLQLGISKLFTFPSAFSQFDYKINQTRLSKIIKNEIEQSNNPHSLEIVNAQSLESALKETSAELKILFSPKTMNSEVLEKQKVKKVLYAIGPEGGFSEVEVGKMKELSFVEQSLPTEILRTDTALSACCGFVLGAIVDASN